MNDKTSLSKKEMIGVICTHEVFEDLNSCNLGKFEEIVTFQTIDKNKRIFEIDDQPNSIFYLLKGALTLRFPDNSKLELTPGEIIGEIGALNGDFRLGALTADEDSRLISISVERLFDSNFISPDISLKIIRRLSKRVTNYLRSVQQTSTLELMKKGENDFVEFKSTLRWNIKAQKKDKNITHAFLKTIAAFLNSDGGILLIGVNDEGETLGLELDQFSNPDKMLLFLTSTIKSQLGTLHLDNVHYNIEKLMGKLILRIDVQAGNAPCYLSSDNKEYFYVRTGPSTTDLRISKIYNYIKKRFGHDDK